VPCGAWCVPVAGALFFYAKRICDMLGRNKAAIFLFHIKSMAFVVS